MINDFEATVTVGVGGRVELVVPNALFGTKIHVAVRVAESDDWESRLAAGTLRGPSLPDEAVRRDSLYSDQLI